MEKTIHANYKHKLEYTHIYLYIFLVGSDNTRKDFPFFSITPNPSHLKYMLKDCPATKKKNSFWTLMEGKKQNDLFIYLFYYFFFFEKKNP